MKFVGVNNMARWIRETGPEAVISQMITEIEKDFRRWDEFELRPRVASHSEVGVIELMPTSDGQTYGFKFVNGHPNNPLNGFQTVTAFGVLANTANGYPRLLAEMTLLTALRTAATSGVAMRYLARPDAHNLALIGAGSQSEFQTLAARCVRPIEQVRVYDIDPAAALKMQQNLKEYGIDVLIADSAAQAVADADIITTCTADKRNARVLLAKDVRPGTHINALGGDCPGKTELDPAILDLGPVFVEYPEQTRIEGEIQNKPADFPVTELYQVIRGEAAGRESADEVTIFDSVGFAIEDFSALRLVDRLTEGTDYFEDIDLIAEPADPKDLFGMTRQVF